MIYRTFKEWKNGNYLEDLEPRKEAYTRDELLLIEMGWKYGFDAGVEAGRKDENDANKDRIETLYMMYKQASQQRNELAQQQTEALRARLAQPEPEPVAWADKHDVEREGHDFYANRQQPAKNGIPLYTAPPQREWQGLTDEEIEKLYLGSFDEGQFARAIESKLKEKNNERR